MWRIVLVPLAVVLLVTLHGFLVRLRDGVPPFSPPGRPEPVTT